MSEKAGVKEVADDRIRTCCAGHPWGHRASRVCSPHPFAGCGPAARPPRLGRGYRGFESLHPDMSAHTDSHRLAELFEWRCHYCERPIYCRTCDPERSATDARWVTRDHVIPVSKGGSEKWRNIVAACFPCNHAKSDSLPDDATLSKPRPPHFSESAPTEPKKPSVRSGRFGGVLIANALWPIFPAHGLDCPVLVFAALNPGKPISSAPECTCVSEAAVAGGTP